jgi:hypothetical protein
VRPAPAARPPPNCSACATASPRPRHTRYAPGASTR